MNYRNLIYKGTSILKESFIKTAQIDAELLLTISLKKSRENILLNLENKLSLEEIKKYLDLINRRKNNEPISFIEGKRFFWKNEFIVNKNVLTPRYETEILIEEVLRMHNTSNYINVLDVGVGSGCILISLLLEKKNWKGTALDVCSLALKTAKCNAKMQQIENRIKFINSDIDNFFSRKYDLIVSNPPYINKVSYNNLDLDVKAYEPHKALYGGINGLDIIEKVVKKSKFVLKNNGLLALEIGHDQYYMVRELLKKNQFYILKSIKDYQNIYRCLIAKKIK